jgi:hypothetical protein
MVNSVDNEMAETSYQAVILNFYTEKTTWFHLQSNSLEVR